MGRHSLSQPEVEQFRRAVFQACVDRRYPELFDEEGLADRADVDDFVQAALARERLEPGAHSLVALTAGIEELSRAIARDAQRAAGGRVARGRQAALVRLLTAAADRHSYSGRWWSASRQAGRAADTVATSFGSGGLGGPLTELALRGSEAIEGHHAAGHDPPSAAHGDQRPLWAKRMLSLYHEGWERGERRRAVICLARAASAGTGCLPLSETGEWIRECERRYAWAEGCEEVDLELFYAYLNTGMFDKAQRSLELLQRWANRDWFVGCSWALCAAEWSIATGDLQGAQSELGRVIAVACEHACESVVIAAEDLLRECDEGRCSPRND
jgi:hypothetical protein